MSSKKPHGKKQRKASEPTSLARPILPKAKLETNVEAPRGRTEPPEAVSHADAIAKAKAFITGPTRPEKKPPTTKKTAPPTLDVQVEALELEALRIEEPRPSEPVIAEEVASQIRELEARLDQMIDESSRRATPTADLPPAHVPRTYPPPPSSRLLPSDDPEATVFDTARELLSTDFYLRKWGRLGMRNRSEEVDDFGFDPVYEQKVRPLFNFLYERYFRIECEGIEKVPAAGRCLLVANHSGTLPYDGAMIKTAVKREHPQARDVRWLAEDFIFHFPFLGAFSNRVGAVRACQENAERLLRQDALVAVFPEGVKGIGKLYRERYRLQRFGRGGFIKLCLRTQTPIVPVAVMGAEETNPMLLRLEMFSKALGLPYIPITATFPLLGPIGLAPAPTKWRIVFGDPMSFDGYGPEAAEDEILVGRLAERVRGSIQSMLDHVVGERRSVWFG